MSLIQMAGVIPALRERSEAAQCRGDDGFVPTDRVCLRTGLCTRVVRRILDAGVMAGEVERRPYKLGYSYRPIAQRR